MTWNRSTCNDKVTLRIAASWDKINLHSEWLDTSVSNYMWNIPPTIKHVHVEYKIKKLATLMIVILALINADCALNFEGAMTKGGWVQTGIGNEVLINNLEVIGPPHMPPLQERIDEMQTCEWAGMELLLMNHLQQQFKSQPVITNRKYAVNKVVTGLSSTFHKVSDSCHQFQEIGFTATSHWQWESRCQFLLYLENSASGMELHVCMGLEQLERVYIYSKHSQPLVWKYLTLMIGIKLPKQWINHSLITMTGCITSFLILVVQGIRMAQRTDPSSLCHAHIHGVLQTNMCHLSAVIVLDIINDDPHDINDVLTHDPSKLRCLRRETIKGLDDRRVGWSVCYTRFIAKCVEQSIRSKMKQLMCYCRKASKQSVCKGYLW